MLKQELLLLGVFKNNEYLDQYVTLIKQNKFIKDFVRNNTLYKI